MFDDLRMRYHAALRRIRRFERREIKQFVRWVEHTRNLTRLTVLVVAPLLIAGITWLSNAVNIITFLIFPPLASGTYTLFTDPEGKYASPTRFVGGMTAGALCGWVALVFSARYLYHVPPESMTIHAGGAALGILLTVLVTWSLDVEQPTAFSSALLVLMFPLGETGSFGSFLSGFLYVVGIAISSSIVAGVFVLWRREFYERRARYLYRSTKGDDHVLVPMRGEDAEQTAMFGAKLAAAHDAGKVVLIDMVDRTAIEEAEESIEASARNQTKRHTKLVEPESAELSSRDESTEAEAEAQAADVAADRLEAQAHRIRTRMGVPCEVVVAGDGKTPARTVLSTAREVNCDLIVAPYEKRHGGLSPFVRGLFRGNVDAIAYRPGLDGNPRRRWKRVLVPVRRAGNTAHTMIDFARRLVGRSGSVSVCTCIDREAERRATESTLADLVEAFSGSFETRVSRSSIEDFLSANDDHYDLMIIGASTDRSAASRFISPPTFERMHEIDCDVAVVHRG
ncbi:HPP family protein [Haladaptatus pallidirubidus]|uniref:HPP family protein n=1 Tax=Haladaptatus pallidirubidus TaxID=1008152 RepID=A0AAV3UFG5_9EURY|nr:HPP family protein [Haladaptatus pallidirubidus]